MSRKPKVSVCIASYNHARYLGYTLDSVLAQTYRDFEIVVVDDGSTDGSIKLLEAYAARHPSINFLTHPGRANKGISATTNAAVREAQGAYLAFTGSDDLWYADKLARQVALLESDAKLGLIYGLAHVIDGEGGLRQGELIGGNVDDERGPLARMIQDNPAPALTVVIRRECLDGEAELFDESIVYSDWELWLRLAARWKIGFTDAPLGQYRVHGRNTSVGINPELHLARGLAALVTFRSKASRLGGASLSDPRLRALLNLQIAYLNYCLDDQPQAERAMEDAFTADARRSDNVAYLFCEWLDGVKGNSYQPLAKAAAGAPDFGAWVAERLQVVAGKSFARRVAKKLAGRRCAEAAFACYRLDRRRARRLILDSWRNDIRWMSDRKLRSIFVESVLGPGLAAQARRAKSAFTITTAQQR